MKNYYRIFIGILAIAFFCNNIKAQDTLIIHRAIDLQVKNKQGEVLKLKYVIKSAEAEELPEVAKCFRRARFYNVISAPFGFAGGALIGYTLGRTVNPDYKIQSEYLLFGAGLVVVQFGLTIGFKDRNIRKGVRLYNEALHSKRMYPPAE